MTLSTWKAEFYPIEASKVRGKRKALKHSLRKWIGLRKGNLEKHGGEAYQGDLRFADGIFEVDSDSCALCELYVGLQGTCEKCPLLAAHAGTRCDHQNKGEVFTPFADFLENSNPEPMIRLLRKALRQLEGK